MEPKIELIGIGERLRNLRKKKNETQKDLASIINSTPDSISKIERGEMRFFAGAQNDRIRKTRYRDVMRFSVSKKRKGPCYSEECMVYSVGQR